MRASNDYRDFLFPLDHPRLAGLHHLSTREYGVAAREVPLLNDLITHWQTLATQPFHGLTCDGTCEHGLFALEDEGAPVLEATAAATALLTSLDGNKKVKLLFPLDAPQWRVWSNPEVLFNDYGLRMEDESETTRMLIMGIVAASLGDRGHAKAQGCMRTNAFLGQLTNLPNIMNEWSYNFLIFGDPSSNEPWGWNLYGHHLCLNCFFVGGQMVVSPIFMGAEPNIIDSGPHIGTKLFTTQEQVGLALMQSLSPELHAKAQIFEHMHDEPTKPKGRWHPADGLHLGGAFQDNRIVPYEGIPMDALNERQRSQLLEVADAFLDVLPDGPRARRLEQIERHFDRTWWSWIGGSGDEDPFYYRIQSPIIMLEFDHHPGIWLNNQLPSKCHIHTVIRTPNGNDYGKDLLRQHYEVTHPGAAPGR